MKMRDKLVFGLLIIIVIVALILAVTSKEGEAPVEEPTAKEMNEGDISSLESGELVQSESEISWEGSKKVIKNWKDGGTIDPAEGTIEVNSEGELTGGSIVFDMSSITVTKTGSGVGFDGLKNHLSSEDFFDVAKYPTATYEITNVEEQEDGTYLLTGDMTIKETTEEVSIPASFINEDLTYRVSGTAEIDRTLFDVRFGSDKFFQNLGDNVINDIFTVSFDVAFAK